jgi:hypothetical protein
MTAESSLKVDPDVKMPAAVLAAAKRSEQMHKQLRDNPVPEGQEGTDGQQAQAAEQPVTQQGNPQAPTDAPLTADAPKTPASEPKPAPQADDEETWERRYKSLHGRYNKQETTIKQMGEEIRSLQQVISTLSVGPAAESAPGASPKTEAPIEDPLTPDEINEYGEDLLRVVAKKARAEVEPLLRSRDEEIARLKRQLEGVNGFVQGSAKERLQAQLDERLPQWRELNTNQDFLNWLALPDPYSGGIRHDMLKAAYSQGNANRVLAFFNGFLAEEAVVAPAKGEQNQQGQVVPKVPLSSLAAPGRAKAAASDTRPAEKPVISRADIAKFYLDVSSGRYRNREADKAKFEAMIFEATREGRIR